MTPHFLYYSRISFRIRDMDVEENNAAAAGNQPAGQSPPRFFKLPDFWTASPAAWFGVAEAQFLLRGTTSQRDRFALVAAVLPEASARRVAHIYSIYVFMDSYPCTIKKWRSMKYKLDFILYLLYYYTRWNTPGPYKCAPLFVSYLHTQGPG